MSRPSRGRGGATNMWPSQGASSTAGSSSSNSSSSRAEVWNPLRVPSQPRTPQQQPDVVHSLLQAAFTAVDGDRERGGARRSREL